MSLEPDELELDPPRPMAPGWMITFADLLSLLLAFFVLLFATTTVDLKDWRRVVVPITEYLSGRSVAAPGVALPPGQAPADQGTGYVEALLQHLIAASPGLQGATVERHEDALVLTLPPAALAPEGHPLADLARLVEGLDNRVEVLAHAGIDRSPNAVPEADWQRALGTALALAREIDPAGQGRRIAALGTVDLPDGPAARRVEVLIYDTAAAGDGHAAP